MPGEIRISVPVHRTEAEEKVLQAILNIFPDATAEITGTGIEASASDTDEFITKMYNQKIRDTARSILFKSIFGNELVFNLNKQAAFAGKVNFSGGDSVLGDIEVRIMADDTEALIKALTRTGVNR